MKQNNAEIQSAMCDRRTDGDGSSDWVDGGVWTGEKLCAPWLAKTGLCKASKKDSEREEREESASSKEEDGGETAAEKAVDATTNEETDERKTIFSGSGQNGIIDYKKIAHVGAGGIPDIAGGSLAR